MVRDGAERLAEYFIVGTGDPLSQAGNRRDPPIRRVVDETVPVMKAGQAGRWVHNHLSLDDDDAVLPGELAQLGQGEEGMPEVVV
jgi:hypothetical protein